MVLLLKVLALYIERLADPTRFAGSSNEVHNYKVTTRSVCASVVPAYAVPAYVVPAYVVPLA